MDLWKLSKLPRPRSMTTAYIGGGLMRDARVDRRQRVTPLGVSDWRVTPSLSSRPARTTPGSATTTSHLRTNYTDGYFNSSTSTSSLLSTVNVKKLPKHTRKLTPHAGDLLAATSDVSKLDERSTTPSRSTMSSYRTESSTSSDHFRFTTQSQQPAAMASQHGATFGLHDMKVSVADVKAQAAEDENTVAQVNSYLTRSTGEMMMTYVSDDVTQVNRGGTTSVNDATQVAVELTHADDVLSVSSDEATKHGETSTTINYITQVSSSNTGENDVTQMSDNDVRGDVVIVVTGDSATAVKESGSHRAVEMTSTPPSSEWRALTGGTDKAGQGRSVTSPRRHRATTSSSTGRSTSLSSYTDDKFSALPRPVLIKSVNSSQNDSTVYWSSQIVIPLLTVTVILALCLLVIIVACAVRYARKYCCCLAPRAGSYTPSTTQAHRQPRRVHKYQEPRAAQLARTEPAYRSVVIIGSDRVARRVLPTKDPARPHWTVRQRTWGNLSQASSDTLPPPPPPPQPSQTIVLGRSSETDLRAAGDTVGGKTVIDVAAQIHGSK